MAADLERVVTGVVERGAVQERSAVVGGVDGVGVGAMLKEQRQLDGMAIGVRPAG